MSFQCCKSSGSDLCKVNLQLHSFSLRFFKSEAQNNLVFLSIYEVAGSGEPTCKVMQVAIESQLVYANSLLATYVDNVDQQSTDPIAFSLNIRTVQRSQVLNEDGSSLVMTSTIHFSSSKLNQAEKTEASNSSTIRIQKKESSISVTDHSVCLITSL